MHVQTDHHILAVGGDKMTLFDPEAGKVLVSATRMGGSWTVHTEGLSDVSSPSRQAAIHAMTEHALTLLPGTGYSTLVPHGLAELP